MPIIGKISRKPVMQYLRLTEDYGDIPETFRGHVIPYRDHVIRPFRFSLEIS